MARTYVAALLATQLCLAGCGSRVLRVENDLLRQRQADLETRLADLQRRAPAPADYATTVDLAVIDGFLDRAGWTHDYVTSGNGHISLPFRGKNAEFGVTIRYFAAANIVFLGTSDYLHLDDVTGTESVVLLLVQLAALNYELLVGKFQLNPETGEILLSMELRVTDGLGYDTMLAALHDLCETADARKPELERAISGLGL